VQPALKRAIEMPEALLRDVARDVYAEHVGGMPSAFATSYASARRKRDASRHRACAALNTSPAQVRTDL
jgi:hypothetical protein